MHDVTPDLIAQIATRLYNKLPGAERVPKAETAALDTAQEAADWPTALGEPFGGKPPAPTPLSHPAPAADLTAVEPLAAAPGASGLSAFIERILRRLGFRGCIPRSWAGGRSPPPLVCRQSGIHGQRRPPAGRAGHPP